MPKKNWQKMVNKDEFENKAASMLRQIFILLCLDNVELPNVRCQNNVKNLKLFSLRSLL